MVNLLLVSNEVWPKVCDQGEPDLKLRKRGYQARIWDDLTIVGDPFLEGMRCEMLVVPDVYEALEARRQPFDRGTAEMEAFVRTKGLH